ncbi:MAG: acyltransferase, partial [Lachnospiraceae bacterium]
MFRKFKKIFKKIYRYVYCKVNPVGYAKSIGVKVGNGVKFYSPKYSMFSTEPWLIKIGDNVHITAEVMFLTHDGGTLVTKNLHESMKDFVICGNIEIGNNV